MDVFGTVGARRAIITARFQDSIITRIHCTNPIFFRPPFSCQYTHGTTAGRSGRQGNSCSATGSSADVAPEFGTTTTTFSQGSTTETARHGRRLVHCRCRKGQHMERDQPASKTSDVSMHSERVQVCFFARLQTFKRQYIDEQHELMECHVNGKIRRGVRRGREGGRAENRRITSHRPRIDPS